MDDAKALASPAASTNELRSTCWARRNKWPLQPSHVLQCTRATAILILHIGISSVQAKLKASQIPLSDWQSGTILNVGRFVFLSSTHIDAFYASNSSP